MFCKEERTQLRNRERALQILRNKLFEMELEKQRSEIASARKSQIGTGSRSEKIKTYNYKDARVSDHRLKNNYPLDNMMQGAALEQNVQVCAALLVLFIIHGAHAMCAIVGMCRCLQGLHQARRCCC